MIFAMRFGDPFGNVRPSAYFVRIDPTSPQRRLLSWTPERSSGVVYHILMDGAQVAVSDVDSYTLKIGDIEPRATIEVIETSPQNREESLLHLAALPGDRVKCSWTAVSGATQYEIFRKLTGGSYGAAIYRTAVERSTLEFIDGPLDDASYVYKLVSSDAEGDSTFDEETIVVSSAPLPPTNVSGSWNPTTKILTISWTASASSDIDHYAIRHNGGSGSIRIDDAPEDTEVGTSWTIDLTGQTGNYEIMVRAVDGDDNEEQSLKNIIAIAVENGVAQGRPAAPDQVEAQGIAGGKVNVSFTYYPSKEGGFDSGGVADEARIYYDNKTGTINWNTPLATLAMSNPTVPTRFSWDSGVLADGDYLFGVRIATGTAGGGTETENTDEHPATVNSDVPGATDLTVEAA